MPENDDLRLRDTEWLYLGGERAYSTYTVAAYERDLERFRERLGKGLFLAAGDLAKFIAKELTVISPRTARRRFAAVRSFYQFLFMEGVLRCNPMRHMKAPKPTSQ